jgi:hypothetical protein
MSVTWIVTPVDSSQYALGELDTVVVGWSEGELGEALEKRLREVGVVAGDPVVISSRMQDPDRVELRIVLRLPVNHHGLAEAFAAEKHRLRQAK